MNDQAANPIRAAMSRADASTQMTREEHMAALATNVHMAAINPRVLLTGYDIRQIRIITRLLIDAPAEVIETQSEVVGSGAVTSSATLDHMAKAVDELTKQVAQL